MAPLPKAGAYEALQCLWGQQGALTTSSAQVGRAGLRVLL